MKYLSYYNAQGGFAFYNDDRFEIDVQGIAYLTSIQGAEFMREISLNWGGAINTELDEGIKIFGSCPNQGEFSLPYEVDGDAIIVYLPFNDRFGTQVMRFERI